MTAQISRFNVQAVGQPKDAVTVAYAEVLVLAQATGEWPPAGFASDLRISRLNIQAVGQPKGAETVAYLETVVLADATAKWPPPAFVSLLRIARFNVQAVGQPKPAQSVAYLETSVLADATAKWPPANFISNLRISRLNLQAVGQPKPAGTVAFAETLVLGKGTPPPDPIPIPAVLDVLRHNWVENPELTTTWSTDVVTSALRLSEERRGLVPRPYRSIRFNWTGAAQGGAARILMTLARMANERFVMPLYTDVSLVDADSSGTVLNASASFRRFQAGGFLVVFEIGEDCEPENIQVREIDVPGSAQITLTASLTGTVPAGAVVLPLIYSEVARSGSLRLTTDFYGSLRLNVQEVTGPTALLPLASGSGGAALFEGVPVFPFPPNWGDQQSVGVQRPGFSESRGRGVSVFLRGDRPLFTFSMKFLSLGRPEAFQLASFFDTRRGRLLPFWIANPQALFEVVSWNVAQVDVVPHGQFQNMADFLSAFAVVLDTGQIILRRATVLVVGDIWRIAFAVPLPAEAADYAKDVERFTSAHFCRFSSDSLTEKWDTNEAARIEIGCQEILIEESITLAVDIVEPVVDLPLTETPRRADLNGKLWLTCNGPEADTYLTKDGSNRVSAWADKYGLHGGVSQATGGLQPLYDPLAFGGRGGVVFDGNFGEFLEGIAPLTSVPILAMGVLEVDSEAVPAGLFVLYNSGNPGGDLFALRLKGPNSVVPATTDPSFQSKRSDGATGVIEGDTLALASGSSPGDKAYEAGVPFSCLLSVFDDFAEGNPNPLHTVIHSISSPTTFAPQVFSGGRIDSGFQPVSGIDRVRIGLSQLGGTPAIKVTIGELVFFDHQTAAGVFGSSYLVDLMFDYFEARWPVA